MKHGIVQGFPPGSTRLVPRNALMRRTLSTATSTPCARPRKAPETTRVSVKRWIPTKLALAIWGDNVWQRGVGWCWMALGRFCQILSGDSLYFIRVLPCACDAFRLEGKATMVVLACLDVQVLCFVSFPSCTVGTNDQRMCFHIFPLPRTGP